MLPISDYEVYIFDCDGVILDSNELKIEAMRNALEQCNCKEKEVTQCIDYFKNNFGKSRYHHIEIFITDFIERDEIELINISKALLENYSTSCKELYMKAEITPGFLSFIDKLQGAKYIASGSAEEELRDVFCLRGLSKYFEGIFGSPTRKADIVNNIYKNHPSENMVMFGDSISDFEASHSSNIDFVGYLAFSNVRDKMEKLSIEYNFPIIEEWSVIR
jgi:phosphoglycolate phosphatase-like HAD superfamily hydrolase